MGGKVLLVDDEPAILKILKDRIEAEQHTVVVAQSGKEALEKFKDEQPDLIITDVMMPEMSGYEFFEALRGMGGEAAAVPMIVISARGSVGQLFEKWAIRRFMPKPLHMPDFLREIEEAIASRADKKKEGRSSEQGEAGKVLLAGVSEYELRRLGQFLESQGYSVLRALDEKDAAKTAQAEPPDFILFEYWEDEVRFDAVMLLKLLAESPETQKIPYAIFCNASLQVSAAQNFSTASILGFVNAKDLLQKLEVLLQLPEFKRSGS